MKRVCRREEAIHPSKVAGQRHECTPVRLPQLRPFIDELHSSIEKWHPRAAHTSEQIVGSRQALARLQQRPTSANSGLRSRAPTCNGCPKPSCTAGAASTCSQYLLRGCSCGTLSTKSPGVVLDTRAIGTCGRGACVAALCSGAHSKGLVCARATHKQVSPLSVLTL